MTPEQRDLLATAYHEAGHAVVAFDQGIPLYSASILPSDGFDGLVTFKNRLARRQLDSSISDRDRLEAERRVRVSLAGRLAQRRFDRNSVKAWHAEQDNHDAVNLLDYFVASERELNAWLRLLGIQTDQILKIRWPQVEGLARELMQRTKMSDRQIRAYLINVADPDV